MKKNNIKKLLFINVLSVFFTSQLSAQLVDLTGSLIIDGIQSREAIKSYSNANKQVRFYQFLNSFQIRVADIYMNSMGDYSGIKQRSENIEGKSIIFQGVKSGQYLQACITPVDTNFCKQLITHPFNNLEKIDIFFNEKKVTLDNIKQINSSSYCQKVNKICLFFQ